MSAPSECVEFIPVLVYPTIGPIRLSPKPSPKFRLFAYTKFKFLGG